MGKKRKKGTIKIFSDERLKGKTMLIILIGDESAAYYAPLVTYGTYTIAEIDVPLGNYIIKVIGEKREQLATVTENKYTAIDWEI